MSTLRLQKYLSECGVASRRKSEKYISDGRVSVNGVTVTEMGTKIDPDKDKVLFDGAIVSPVGEYVYIALNKPAGVVSTCSDESGRKCLSDLTKDVGERIYPVGRLDLNSEGLIILTNDGTVTNKLTHPRHRIRKKYVAVIDSSISESEITKLMKGVDIGGYVTAPAFFKIISVEDNRSEVLCVISEGKNRQIRRMFEALGKNVTYLKRVAFGDIMLGNLKKGSWRYLTTEETEYLKKL